MTGRNHCNSPPVPKARGSARWFACPDCGWVTGRRSGTLLDAAKDWNGAIDVLSGGPARRLAREVLEREAAREWELVLAVNGTGGALWLHRRCERVTKTQGPVPPCCRACALAEARDQAFEPWWTGEEADAEISPEGQSRLSARPETRPEGGARA